MEAARKLEISQPALSESIMRLESDASTKLFYRSRTGIQLTPSGRVFLRKAKALIEKVQDLDFSENPDTIFNGQSITVGCHTTVARYSIPKSLAILREEAPDFKIELRHDLSRNIQTEIQRGNIDIGVVINPTFVPDLVISKIAIDTVRVWHSKGGSEDLVACDGNMFQTQAILKKWKDQPGKVLTTDSLELICQIVHEGTGFGIIPERAVALSGFPLKAIDRLPKLLKMKLLLFIALSSVARRQRK